MSASSSASGWWWVEADIDDQNLASFINTRNGDSSFQQTGFNLDPVDSVEFQFTAGKKPGKTTLQFQCIVGGVDTATGYVSFPVGIDIKICNDRITTVTRFRPNGKNNPDIIYPPIVISKRRALIKADADGNFAGRGTSTWVGPRFQSGCLVRQAFGDPSPVIINGGLIDGELSLHVAIDRSER